MIYRKDANFPYPILTNTSSSYENSEFVLDVQVQENVHYYRFDFEYSLDSDFINNLLKHGKAQLYLVIQSKDNKSFKLDPYQKFVDIKKSRISLNNRTSIQLFIQSRGGINFGDNFDLSPFYQDFKEEIVVPNYSVLGYSNIVLFDGSFAKPLELFEKKIDPALSSDIKIELGSETIIIHYKDEALQFSTLPKSQTLNNPYVYMGLQKALLRMIANYGSDDEVVDIEEMEPPTDQLDFKLYNLMKRKMISELSMDTIDTVIYSISDRILEKYSAAVKELSSSGN